MGTSASNSGGSGGAWTDFKRDASLFARHGGRGRAAKALAGYVAVAGGAAAATSSAAAGIRAGQSLGRFLAASTGPTGMAGGLEAVGLANLVGVNRFEVLSGLADAFAGPGSDIEEQAARDALLDVLNDILPDDATIPLVDVRLDETAVIDALRRFVAALVYNRAIPTIDERLTRLQNPQLARQRDEEIRGYIEVLVRLRTEHASPLTLDWRGPEGAALINGVLRAAYDQLEAFQ